MFLNLKNHSFYLIYQSLMLKKQQNNYKIPTSQPAIKNLMSNSRKSVEMIKLNLRLLRYFQNTNLYT
jgi:hypothetical protein